MRILITYLSISWIQSQNELKSKDDFQLYAFQGIN